MTETGKVEAQASGSSKHNNSLKSCEVNAFESRSGTVSISRLKSDFDQLKLIGEGGFGKVFKVP